MRRFNLRDGRLLRSPRHSIQRSPVQCCHSSGALSLVGNLEWLFKTRRGVSGVQANGPSHVDPRGAILQPGDETVLVLACA